MMQLEGADMAIHSSQIHPCSWEEVYQAAVLEPDNALLEPRIRAAEEALLTRWLEVTKDHDYRVEIQAIVDAIKGLRILKRERLRDSRASL
jgi:hypothetical protein